MRTGASTSPGLHLGRLASYSPRVLATLSSGRPVPSVSYVDWLDLPIVSGDPFVPVHPCRALSKSNAWLFQPHSVGGGIWCRVPGHWTTPEGLAVLVSGAVARVRLDRLGGRRAELPTPHRDGRRPWHSYWAHRDDRRRVVDQCHEPLTLPLSGGCRGC